MKREHVHELVDNALVTIDDTRVFPALVDPTNLWNGWLSPGFTRETAEEVVRWIEEVNGPDDDQLSWDGDEVVHETPMYRDEPGYRPDRIGPTEHDGRYYIGSWQWTWTWAGPEVGRAWLAASVAPLRVELDAACAGDRHEDVQRLGGRISALHAAHNGERQAG